MEATSQTPKRITTRLIEIEEEMEEIRALKIKNPLSQDDIECVSDNYQYHLEWNAALAELRDEKKDLTALLELGSEFIE